MWVWKEFSEGWARRGAWGRVLAGVVSSMPFTYLERRKDTLFVCLFYKIILSFSEYKRITYLLKNFENTEK